MKFARLLFLIPALLCLGFSKKQAVIVRFHAEANAHDGGTFAMPVKLLNPPRDAHLSRMAVISERNITAIYPFIAANKTNGCSFKLDERGRLALATLSNEQRGASVVAYVGTKIGTHQVIDMIIDRPVTDGIVTIQRGLTDAEIAALRSQFPVIGIQTKKPAPEKKPRGIQDPGA